MIASPRRNGNSVRMAAAFAEGFSGADDKLDTLVIEDFVDGFLRDCRVCRDAEGNCTIGDRYSELLIDHLVPADAIVIATPIYWYGLPGQLKTIIDRLVCYTASSYPGAEGVVRSLAGKRYVLLASSEESSYGMSVGILQQMSDFCRYTHGSLVAFVNAVGNRRGEVERDPGDPLEQARRIGRDLFDLRATDYRIDTPRSGTVWSMGGTA